MTSTPRFGSKEPLFTRGGIAISSHPLVSETAVDVLQQGGNACDALLTAAYAQTIVEPHMSTLTGVLSLLYYDVETGQYSYLNGSGAAPRALASFNAAEVATGKGVAVPGWFAAAEQARERHGSRSREQLMAPAIRLAREGVAVTPFLFAELFSDGNPALRTAAGRQIFAPDRRLLEPGELLLQLEAADLYERLAAGGVGEFYDGAFAERLVDTVQQAGGILTREDLLAYRAEWMEPARGSYRDVEIIASPPPDQGGTHVIEMLQMLEQLPLHAWGPATASPDTLEWMVRIHNHVLEEGKRQGDPRGHHLPLDLITSKDYAQMRLELLRMTTRSSPLPAQITPPGSNHLTVVDTQGNVATALHSCMALPWTNGLFVDGISVAAVGAHYPRRLPGPGERINSIVAPTILARDGRPLLAAGSPSGALLANLVQATTNLVDFGEDLQTSVHKPRFGGPSNKTMYGGGWGAGTFTAMLESDFPDDVRAEAERRGLAFDLIRPWSWENGSLEAVQLDGTLKTACGDPRRYSQPAVTDNDLGSST